MLSSQAVAIALLLLMGLRIQDAFLFTQIVGRNIWVGRLSSAAFEFATSDKGESGSLNTITTSYETIFHSNTTNNRSRVRQWFRKNDNTTEKVFHFSYDYNELIIKSSAESNSTTGVMLIHPIGVGIGRWYYDRLLNSLNNDNQTECAGKIVFLAPDLLGSGSASAPYEHGVEDGVRLRTLPLLNITDWSNQLTKLMADCELKSKSEGQPLTNWVVVANGGCSPIALKVAEYSVTNNTPFSAPITNAILSSPPNLPFFLESTDPIKVHKSYRTLSGTIGKLFWWYALRNKGRFIQKFSERNLVGNPESLGDQWTPNCLATAKLYDGQSKYSTFAFLAGALQDGCLNCLNTLRGSDIEVDFIRGRDVRRNRARSWFWSRKNKKPVSSTRGEKTSMQEEGGVKQSIQQYIRQNGNGGKEVFVNGRISLAWEDADGYAKSILDIISEANQ